MAGIISFEYLEDLEDVKKVLDDNKLSYCYSKEYIVKGAYGHELVTIRVDFIEYEGDREYTINEHSFKNIDTLLEYAFNRYFN